MRRRFIRDKENITNGLIPSRTPTDVDYNDINYFTNNPKGQYPLDGTFLDPEGPYKWKTIHTIRRILEMKPNAKTILDVGSGPCHIAYWVNKLRLPIKVTNYDISESLFDHISKKGLLFGECIVGDIRDLHNLAPQQYDVLVFSDILEHVYPKDAQRSLNAAYSLLNPNKGLLYINVPNRNSWSHRSYHSPAHVWLPSITEMTNILKTIGFSSQDINVTTRGFPGSKLYTNMTAKDIELPLFGRSIIITAFTRLR